MGTGGNGRDVSRRVRWFSRASRSASRRGSPRGKRISAGRQAMGERLESRDLMATFAYNSAYLEATLTDLLTGESEVVRLSGSVAGEVSSVVSPLTLDESSQSLTSLSLSGVEPNRFGTLSLTLNPQSPTVGRVVEQSNLTPSSLEFPATSQLDLDFVLEITRFDTPFAQPVTLTPAGAVRIEAGVSQSPTGPNDTFHSRARTIYLTDTPAGSPVYSLSDFAFSFQAEMGKISGQKFNDANGNVKRDPGELGLNGWAVALVDQNGGDAHVVDIQTTHDIDWNNDQVIDPETERGWYVFESLAPAKYFVTEVGRAGWKQTAPLEVPSTLWPDSLPFEGWIGTVIPRKSTERAAVVLSIDWPDDGNLDGQVDERVIVGVDGGDARFGIGAPALQPGNMFSAAPLELGSYELVGQSRHGQVMMTGGDGDVDFASGVEANLGQVAQSTDNLLLADAQIELDFTLAISAFDEFGLSYLRPATPVSVQAVVDRLPLDGFVLTSSNPVALVDDQLATRARLVGVEWVFYQEETLEVASGYDLPLSLGREYRSANLGNQEQPPSSFGVDFGDARFSLLVPGYPTTLADDGARHAIDGLLYLGAKVDAETDGTPSDMALGDDGSASDDEDGVAFHGAAVAGETLTLTVTASRLGQLDAWIDFNADGDWDDDGEQVFVSQTLVSGENELTIPIPVDALAGITYSRFRLSSSGGLSVTGAASDGEVEDHALVIHATTPPLRDFGDANNDLPDLYPTRESEGGAWHSLTSGHYLGDFVDGEIDGTSTLSANGDDIDGLADEDGVRVIEAFQIGGSGELEVRASLPGYLNAWIDFNQDGDWDDAGEYVIDARLLDQGANRLTIAVPTELDGARPSARTPARFRFTEDPTEGRTPGGGASTGEVEDHLLSISYPVVNVAVGAWNLALGLSATPNAAPGIVGLSTSPLESDSLDPRFSQLAAQTFFYRLAGDSGESSLDSLQFMSAQVDYAGSQVVVRYGDPAKFDPLEVVVFYTLSSFDANSITIDELVVITNLTPDPLSLAWFAFADANLNGAFGEHDSAVAESNSSFLQTGQLGSQLQITVASEPFPEAYELAGAAGLQASLTDTSPTSLGSSPGIGVSTSNDDIAQALQWNLTLGVTDDDRTTLLNVVKVFQVTPVVSPEGQTLTGASGGATAGGAAAGGLLGAGVWGGEAGGAGAGSVGTPGPADCRGLCILDPAVAVGYDFVSQTGNLIAEITLPFGFGDDQYLLQWPDGLGGWNDVDVQAGQTYSFLGHMPSGASHFRVLGIEPAEGIDPLDPLGFPTLLRFVNPLADWKVQMTAIPDRVYVDPTGGWGEEVNVREFGVIELGDIVTYRPGQSDEVAGLRFGESAFANRTAALAYLESLDISSLTEIVEVAVDMGDAPNSYGTLSVDSGPTHVIGALFLGNAVDADADGQPTANADGDDTNGVLDEDGVAMLNTWQAGGTAELRVTTSGAGVLNAWVDWNDDGDWNDAGEQVFVDRALSTGPSLLSFAVPINAVVGQTTYSRFRLSSQTGLGPTGTATDGEVEDYVVPVIAAVSRAETVYPASQAEIVLRIPGGAELTIPLVGSSSTQLLTSDTGSATDSDSDQKDDAAQEVKSFIFRGWSSLGRVDVSLLSTPRSLGRIEETSNLVPGILDITPFSIAGTATSFYDVYLEITVTNGATVNTYRTPTPARLTGNVSGDPTFLGELLTGASGVGLVDTNGAATNFVLVSQSYTPNPLRPWHNIVNRLDVDNSGEVVPLDALLVINELNNPFYSISNQLPAPVSPSLPPPPYLDVSASGSIEPLDALLVINFLNGVDGEGEEQEAVAETVVELDGHVELSTMAVDEEPDSGLMSVTSVDSSASEGDVSLFSAQGTKDRRRAATGGMTPAERRARWEAWVAYWSTVGRELDDSDTTSRFRRSGAGGRLASDSWRDPVSESVVELLANSQTIDPDLDAT